MDQPRPALLFGFATKVADVHSEVLRVEAGDEDFGQILLVGVEHLEAVLQE